MAEEGKFETAEKRMRIAYSKFGMVSVVVGLLALVVAIVGVVIVLPSEKTEVTAQVLASDELTKYSSVAGLRGSFTYADEEVTHLWKLRIQFVNSGDKTIIGTGNQANILDEGLNFVFPDDTRVLRIEEEASTFQSTIVQPKPNHVQIQFSQWRPSEYTIISFYVASDEPLDADPLPTIPIIRGIVDGDVLVQDLTEEIPRERISMIDRLPEALITPGKIIGGIYAGLGVIILIIVMPWGWRDSLPLIIWKRHHLSAFVNYLDQVEPKLSNYRKERFSSKPHKVPEKFWANFDGPKAPSKTPMFDSIAAGTVVTLMSLVAAFGFVSVVLILIPT